MKVTINITEGDKRYEGYEDIVKRAKEGVQRSDNLFIVAHGEDNRKANIEPLVVMRDIVFYAAHKVTGGFVYRNDIHDELIQSAVSNTIEAARILPMSEVITSFPDCEFQKIDEWNPARNEEPLFVLTSEDRLCGAGILFCNDVLHKIWEKIGNYYIIPSSIHELLIYAEDFGLEWREISQMIKAVNSEVVSKEERLSDNPFYYDGELKGGA